MKTERDHLCGALALDEDAILALFERSLDVLLLAALLMKKKENVCRVLWC